jgi:hypothetical protein
MRGYWGILQAAAWTWIVTLLSAQRDCEQDWVGAGCSHRPGPVVCVLALPTVFLIKASLSLAFFFLFVCLFVLLFSSRSWKSRFYYKQKSEVPEVFSVNSELMYVQSTVWTKVSLN